MCCFDAARLRDALFFVDPKSSGETLDRPLGYRKGISYTDVSAQPKEPGCAKLAVWFLIERRR